MADTLDQIREHLEAIRDACTPDDSSQYEPPRAVLCREHAVAALAKFDALLAEGHFAKYDGHNYWPDWWPDFPDTRYKYRRVLVLDFSDGRDPLVGVGCGNAKKDTP